VPWDIRKAEVAMEGYTSSILASKCLLHPVPRTWAQCPHRPMDVDTKLDSEANDASELRWRKQIGRYRDSQEEG